jgi:hypothetical protein
MKTFADDDVLMHQNSPYDWVSSGFTSSLFCQLEASIHGVLMYRILHN